MLLKAESTARQGGSVLNGQPEQAEKTVETVGTVGWVEQRETHQRQSVFDGQSHVVRHINARKKVTWFSYDSNQNLRFTVNALHQQSEKVYDSQFQLIRSLNPLNNQTLFSYDAQHHLTLATDALGNTVGASYYPDGRTQTTTDGRNHVTTLTYDAFGNPDTIQTGVHPLVATTYNALGQRTALTDQAGATTRFTYNKRGQVTGITDPLLHTTSFTYDAAGRLRARTDRNGQTVTFAYTPSGKTKTITYPDNASVAFTYTPAWENVASMTDALGTSRYTYDAARRLISQTDANGFTLGYAYDAAGNLTTLTYPNNETVSYTYDALNRLKTVSLDWLGQTTTYTYDPAGRLTQRVNFNSSITHYTYDQADRLTGLTHRTTAGKTIASYQFPILDGNGNRVQEIRTAPQVPVSLAVATTHFSYNPPATRLLTTSNTSSSDSFTYDAQGQTINKNGTPYSWDYEHRLIGQGASQYFYDGVGNRLKAINHGITTKYIYDARGHLIAEADASNAITRYYIYGAGLLAMVKNNNVYTYHHNALGSTVAITDHRQTIINTYSYTPYGQIVDQKETIKQPFKYVGKYGVMTEANGLYYMRARYYDSETGRFISEDPKGFGGGQVNLYAYVGGNPVMGIDPNGLTRWGDFRRGLGIILFTNAPKVDSAIEKRLVENYFIGNGDDFYLTPAETIRFRQHPRSSEFNFGIGRVSDPSVSGLLDRYDFNAGNRSLYAEVATEIAGAIGPPLGGKDFNVYTALGK